MPEFSPIDYATPLARAGGLVPNYAEQQMQRRMFDMQSRAFSAEQQEKQRAIDEEAAFRSATEQVMIDPSPQGIARLALRFPKRAEQIQAAWKLIDADRQKADLTQIGSIYSLAQGGQYDQAAQFMQRRVDADKAAGQSDPVDEAILTALKSGDPIQQKAAAAQIGMQLAMIDPAKFGETYGKLFPTDAKTGTQKEYEWRAGLYGKEAADTWMATKDIELVPVEKGGSIYSKSDFIPGAAVPQPRGGDQSTGGQATPDLERMLAITMQSESGGKDFAPGGGYLTSPQGARGRMQVMPGTERDPGFGVRPAQNDSPDELARVGRDYFKAMMARYGEPAKAWAAYNAGPGRLDAALAKGGDWPKHMPSETRKYVARNMSQLRKGGASAEGGPVQVNSVQQARKLPPGTVFRTPDGRTMRVPN